ncbi:MAG: UDP-glucose 4-epimerase GalE [Flammeovirgaceae bacterium]|nr:UDP-glucose 4-epimerase GalE [Flammeovirgaceae bacterium]
MGSHTCVELIKSGYEVSIIDNLVNSERFILDRIEKISGEKINFYEIDIKDLDETRSCFKNKNFDLVIHFAALKSVNESVKFPDRYYRNNIGSLENILKCIELEDVGGLVFSSSCTVYGQPDILPVTETSPLKKAESPYAETKQICEKIIKEFATINKKPSISLRYFNPVGAHESGLIGELPRGVPDNLVPYITQTAIGKRDKLKIFGDDYNTKDGTPIRDYIHVVDLAEAHVSAVDRLINDETKDNYEFYNVGTGTGYSVLEVIKSFERINKIKLSYEIVGRREGDIESIYSDNKLSSKTLNWRAIRDLDQMMKSAWIWEKKFNESDS